MLLGSIQALAMTYPLGGSITALVQTGGMAIFIYFISRVEKTYLQAWLFVVAWLFGSVGWLYISLHVYGHMSAPLSVAAILILCGGLALYYSTVIWGFKRLQIQAQSFWGVMVLAAGWTMAEMARAQWFTGFPWAAIGYGQINSHLSYLAPWFGVYGVGFVSVLLAGLIALAWNEKTKKRQFFVVMSLLLLLVPAQRSAIGEASTLSVALLQANIPQDLKFSSGREEALIWYREELLKSKADITVLPETAIPYFKNELPPTYWQPIEDKYQNKQQAAIIGIPTRNIKNEYGNSALALGMTEGPSQYDKYHLVPFGEFTPTAMKWFTQKLDMGMTDFVRGSQRPEPMVWKNHKLSVNICYEDLFGEELAQRFVQAHDKAPDVLVNISNIAWFGNNFVVDQHLNIARMRSLEFNRPTVRATNTGATAIINAQGEIQAVLEPYTRGVLTGLVATISTEITPYAYWAGRWGLKPLWLFCVVIWLIAYWQYKNRLVKNSECAQ